MLKAYYWTRGVLAMIIGWPFTVIAWLFVFVILLPLPRSLRYDVIAPLARLWGRAVLWFIGIRMVQENPSTMTEPAARVMIINHPATLDVVWAAAILPPRCFGIGKRELMYIPFFNLVWYILGFVFLDRGNSQEAIRDLERVYARMHNERLTVMLAPEGTRSKDGSMGPFKKGAFQLAMHARVKIHPIVVAGAYECMPKHRFVPFPGEIRIRYLEPIDTKEWSADHLDEHIEAVRQSMNENYISMSQMVAKIRADTM